MICWEFHINFPSSPVRTQWGLSDSMKLSRNVLIKVEEKKKLMHCCGLTTTLCATRHTNIINWNCKHLICFCDFFMSTSCRARKMIQLLARPLLIAPFFVYLFVFQRDLPLLFAMIVGWRWFEVKSKTLAWSIGEILDGMESRLFFSHI